VAAPLYLDSSAVLRALLETGTSPELESRLKEAPFLVTSRLSLVETSRALLRLRREGKVPETTLADQRRALDELWSRTEIWEITERVCRLAQQAAPLHPLRTLDALHLATYLEARSHLSDLELLTADKRLAEAAGEFAI